MLRRSCHVDVGNICWNISGMFPNTEQILHKFRMTEHCPIVPVMLKYEASAGMFPNTEQILPSSE